MENFAVEMRDICKSFGEVKAVNGGQFQLRKGEIHSLIGENGAGKSTMMKLLYGMYPLDGGEILINGEKIDNLTPKTAIEHGVGMVHQEFMLVDELTVLENVILGFEPRKGIAIDFDKAKKDVRQYIDKYNMDIQVDKRINQISVGEAQRVEIIKILSRGADIIILDEPTGVLTPQETEKLFEILRNLKEAGKSIIFISHKLREVMEISDRISVMRGGQYMGTVLKEETSPQELAKKMVGREVFLDIKPVKAEKGEDVLEVDNLWTSGEKELSKIRGISFNVKAGEIVGIAGVDGNGQSELAEAIAGLRKVERGSIKICGKTTTNRAPGRIRKSGLANIPEDRNKMGLNRGSDISTNLIITDLADYCKGIVVDKKCVAEHAKDLTERFDIRPRDPATMLSAMSGGNAQKVVVAREVNSGKKLLIASQPTRGIDIGAIEQIREILQQEKQKGNGILLISTELEEILSLSDRILVMYEGKITGTMDVEDATEENLGILMLGGSIEKASGEESV